MTKIFIIAFIIAFIIFYFVNKLLSYEKFYIGDQYSYVTTWTPYIIDKYNQPGFSNYFYNNGYMYPVF